MDVWTKKFPLGFSFTDRGDRLSLWAMFDFFQEAATFHAEVLGVGKNDLDAKRQGWALSRMELEVLKRPHYNEEITVRTWPHGSEKLFAIRDYDIYAGDEPLVLARSNWLIWDIDNRRPLRIGPIAESLPANEGRDSLPADRRIVPALGEMPGLQACGSRKAAYSDVDSNGHVNNARYIQWIQDITEPAILENADKMHFVINYVAEIHPGETIDLFCGGGCYEGRKQDGTVSFRAKLEIV
ncbi:MAG: acyl-ACP thioesterase [Spirochaetaceae bacterium]|jgi:acyl-ACP thioesterase|nr:acyl-ACP thioesterase [Spirochaetaceae bacterium]